MNKLNKIVLINDIKKLENGKNEFTLYHSKLNNIIQNL